MFELWRDKKFRRIVEIRDRWMYMESMRRFDDVMMLVIGIIIYMIKDRSGRINESEREREDEYIDYKKIIYLFKKNYHNNPSSLSLSPL